MSDRLKIRPHSGSAPPGGSEQPHTRSREAQGRVVRKAFSSQRSRWPEGRPLLKGSMGGGGPGRTGQGGKVGEQGDNCTWAMMAIWGGSRPGVEQIEGNPVFSEP